MAKTKAIHPSTIGGKTPSGRALDPAPSPDPVPAIVVESAVLEAPAAVASAPKGLDPSRSIVLEIAAGMRLTVPRDQARQPRQTIDGRNWEHVSDDAEGRWVYRLM